MCEVSYLISDFVVLIVWAAEKKTAKVPFSKLVVPIALHLVFCFFYIGACILGIVSILPMLRKAMQLIFFLLFITFLVLMTLAQLTLLITIVAITEPTIPGLSKHPYKPVHDGYVWSLFPTIFLPIALIMLSITPTILVQTKRDL